MKIDAVKKTPIYPLAVTVRCADDYDSPPVKRSSDWGILSWLLSRIDKQQLHEVCRVQALTAEMNMQTAKEEEDKSEITSLRQEVHEWKQKYYDCRRKLVAK